MGGTMSAWRIRPLALLAGVATLVGLMILAPTMATAEGDLIGSRGDATIEDNVVTVDLATTRSSDVTLSADPSDDEDDNCEIDPTPERLRADGVQSISFTLADTCDVGDEGFSFVITATSARGNAVGTLDITANESAPASTDWGPLWMGLICGTIAAFITVLIAVLWSLRTRKDFKPNRPLESLGADWSFSESWASNITVGATIVTAVLASSDALTAVIGEEPTAALGICAVGAALSVALAAAGGLVNNASKSKKVEGVPTALGVVLAAFFTLTAVFSEAGTVAFAAMDLKWGVDDFWPRAGLTLATTLLVWYGIRSLSGMLAAADPEDEEDEEDPSVEALADIARAIRNQDKPAPAAPAAPAVRPTPVGAPPIRRAALL